jgi:phosphotransferase system enzyme I (PtsI)
MNNFKEVQITTLENKNSNDSPQNIIFKGIPSSPGIAFGKAVVIKPDTILSPNEKINESLIEDEIQRYLNARDAVIEEFRKVIEKVDKNNKSVIAVLETNLYLITDPFLEESIIDRIKDAFSADYAIITEIDTQSHFLKHAKDQILRDRAIELDHLKERLIASLRNQCINYAIEKNSIIVAQSLTPTDLINLHENGLVGFITEVGGISSHTSILARNFEIPEVIGLTEATTYIDSGTNIIIDGYSGTIIINPSQNEIDNFYERKSREEEHKKTLGTLVKLPSETSDGVRIKILANVDFPHDIDNAILVGAEGIGLVRTEHLILSKQHLPSEDEQFEWYNELAQRAYPNPVTIRAFDLGSDKYAEGIPKHESNPALGFRGIRFLLQRKDIFSSQIKAILRASRNKNIKFMIPMITRLTEILTTKKLIQECMNELDQNNITFDKNLPLGIMIETPSAAIMSDKLADYVDFFSIGTNDLTQYTLAADRTNEMVAEIYDSFHPSVLRLIKMIVEGASKRKISVSICGEMAGHSAATQLLLGFGVNELSVSPSALLELKSRIRSTSMNSAIELSKSILDISIYDEIRKKLGLN